MKLKKLLNENTVTLNKKDVSYQLSIDYTGNTKPKVTKLNKKGMTVFYGYKVNPKDVIKSLNKLEPSMKIKHKGWSINSQGGGTHSFIFEVNDLVFNHGKFGGTGVPFPITEPNEFAYLDFKKWAKKMEPKIKKQMTSIGDQRIFRAMEFVWQTWDKKANKGAFSNIKGTKFGRALVKMMWEDNLVFDKKSNKIIKLKELLSENKFSEAVEGVEISIEGMAVNVAANVIAKALKSSYGGNAGKIVLAINKLMKIR